MDFGDRIKVNVPVDAGEAEEVLVLQPAGGGPFEDLAGQLVLPAPYIGRQVEFRRGKAVFAVAHIAAVAPEGQTALCASEADEDFFTFHKFRQTEITYIAAHRICPRGHLAGRDLLSAVPGILDVDIGRPVPGSPDRIRPVQTFHLDMGRHMDVIPGPAVKGSLLKPLDGALGIGGP